MGLFVVVPASADQGLHRKQLHGQDRGDERGFEQVGARGQVDAVKDAVESEF